MFDPIWLLVFLGICVVVRLLHLTSSASAPSLYYRRPCSPFIQTLLKACPILTQVYRPPALWGKSGHVQTMIYVTFGRMKPKSPQGVRHHILMPDGASMSFDVYDPYTTGTQHKAKFTIVVCPGIANSSESKYVRTFVDYAQGYGYRVAVQNHLGALTSEVLSSPRIFTYGGTDEYGAMVDRLLELYPDSRLLALGFSMGGNIITKYLGEHPAHAANFLCGMSVCQGYDINDAQPHFLSWAHMRRAYTYAMTLKQRKILAEHHAILFGERAVAKYGQFNEANVFSATCLHTIDENYSCINAGFNNLYDYYRWSSSACYMQNITIPMLYLNSEDDPLCPPPLFKYARQQAERSDNAIFITTKHGGHLGFFEDGCMIPDHFTWLDRILVEYSGAIRDIYLCDNIVGVTATTAGVRQQSEIGHECDVQIPSVVTSVDSNSSTTEPSSCDADRCHTRSRTQGKDNKNARRRLLSTGKIVNQHTSLVQ